MVNDEQGAAPPPVARRPRTWPVLLLGAVILLSGIAIGAGGMMLWRPTKDRRGPPPDPATGAEIAARIAERCDLSEEQTTQVREIIAGRLEELHAIGREMADRVEEVHNALRDEMKEALTPEQFETWSSRFSEVQQRVRRFRSGRSRGRGRPRGSHRHLGPESMLRRFDANEDGKLVEEEVPPVLWRRLSRFDTDGDHAVGGEELKAAREAPHHRAEEERKP